MTDIVASTIVEAMNWRYAAKAFNRTKKISDADRTALLEALCLSPSSYGLLPWKFVVVDDPATRDKLGELVPPNKANFEDSSRGHPLSDVLV